MMNKKIAAVVVTYNRKKLLAECIDALLAQTYRNLDILVIDNASTDGTREIVKAFKNPQIRYINTGENLGGAGGFQFGVKQGVNAEYDYLWLMDDDSIPTPNALEKLIETADTVGNFGFLSSKVLWKDQSLCKMNIPKVSLNHKLTNFNGNKPKKIIMGTFVSFLVPVKVVKEIGLPIKEFFIWADDFEYSRRISRKYSAYFVPESIVIHKCKSNTGSNIVNDSSKRFNRYRYAYRNEVYLYRREGIAGWNHLLLKTGLHLTKVILKAPDNKKTRLKIIWESTLKGLSFNPKIEYINNGKEKNE
ncbi:glycosyltransferase family 2 protein [Limosilactobacillus balticus]|uniref:glycosyltransferase family 2 protein n=1 Tax=Limosilactobacillus balticus TaxID=2759747 RepID=UPI001E34442A|nr:glycosyltransferase family 2 protein [Limosilactobacillus balticus]MCD7133327.1 glycosyltransferase family 2 protein [Limosilactobacillus balticus]